MFCGDMSDKFSEFSTLVDFIDLEIHMDPFFGGERGCYGCPIAAGMLC